MQSNNNNHLYEWLKRRGISDEVIALFNIDTAYNHPDIGVCIRIPISGAVDPLTGEACTTFSKYRRDPLQDLKPKYLYDRGGKVTLYGADKVDPSKPVLITEGELDTLVAWSHNICAMSSTGGALSFQPEWADLLATYQVYLCFDNDDAGAEGMVKVLQYLPNAKVVLIPETPGVKDISDYVSRGGDLHQLLKTAKSYPDVTAVEEDMRARSAAWQSIRFHEKYLDHHRQKEQRATRSETDNPSPYTGNDKVLRAKSYPMTELIEFKKRKALCPWHNERTESLQYYPKNNNAYCFGCGKFADSIDAYMLKHNVSFTEAVRELNKLV